MGIAVRGLYGEGSDAQGSFYQISNQITMGMTEEELIEKLKNIVNQIKEHEEKMRKRLMKENKTEIEDRVWRSFGTLKYARSISSKEAKALLSDVIMGKNMGIIKGTDANLVELMIDTEPHILSFNAKKELSPDERDVKRAEVLREAL